MNAVKSEYDDETVKGVDSVIPTPTLSAMASAPQPSAVVVRTQLHDTDVIISLPRHHRIYHSSSLERHPGNIAYKKLVSLNRDLVASARLSLDEKLRVAQTIVITIRQMRGRFVECRNDDGNGTSGPSSNHRRQLSDLEWREVDDARAIELTSDSLWECPSDGRITATASPAPETAAPLNPPLRSIRVEHTPSAASNITDPRPLVNAAAAITREASSPVNVPLEIATVKHPPTAARSAIDSSMLINLSPNQTVNLNYPVGSKVLYNVDCTSEQYSDANIGIVKSVSMDLMTRNMLFVVGHLNAPEKSNNCIVGGGHEIDADDNLFFTEEQLSIAPLSPVTIEAMIRGEKQKLEGEVLSCQALHGAGNTAKKVYTVLVHVEKNKVRTFHRVSEECIRCRMLAEEQQSSNQHEATQPRSMLTKEERDGKETSQKPLSDDKLQNSKVSATPKAIATAYRKDMIASQVTRSAGDDSSSVPSSDSSVQSNLSSAPTSLCEIFSSGTAPLATAVDKHQTTPPVEQPYKPSNKKWTPPKLNDSASSGKGNYHAVGRARGNDNSRKDPRSNGRPASDTRSNGNGSNLGKSNVMKDGQNNNRDRLSPGSGSNEQKKKRSFFRVRKEHKASLDGSKQGQHRNSGDGRTEEARGGHNHDEKMENKGKVEGKAWTPKNESNGSRAAGMDSGNRSHHIRFDAPVEAVSKKKRPRRGS
ncbi:hypothetical protein HJC23_010100 [Cyclotella cryptica]|uniref:DUF6824 domain-containing protein n=1 Tax=Cyclotella cryptica TaxID=29204 RepID=A0ABD3Q3R3_9STRA